VEILVCGVADGEGVDGHGAVERTVKVSTVMVRSSGR
jgi:hypothetical protein